MLKKPMCRMLRLTFFILLAGWSLHSHAQRARLFTTDTELPNSLIHDIHQDRNELIWIATSDGLCNYDGAKITTYRTNNSNILSNYVKVIYEDSQGRMFFGFFNGLQVYDPDTDSFTSIPLILANDYSYDAHVTSIVERSNGDILIGGSGLGIFQLNEDTTTWVARQKPELIQGNLIRSLYEDDDQNLWVATHDEGLYKIAADGTQRLYQEYYLRDIVSIIPDDQGNLFLGNLKNGLFKYSSKSRLFEQVGDTNISLPIVSLIHTQSGRILIGTDGSGIKYYDQNTKKIAPINYNLSNLNLSETKVHCMLEDNAGNTWLGLYQKGVALIPSEEKGFEYIGSRSLSYDLIGSKYISSIWKEDNGNMWVGTDGNGVYQVYEEDGKLHSHNYPSSPPIVLSSFQDSRGTLWVGSYGEGLYYLDDKQDKFKYFGPLKDNEGKEVVNITSFAEDRTGRLWIGTLGVGLFYIEPNSNKAQLYSESKGDASHAPSTMHNHWVSSLHLAQNDTLYIGTYDGIALLDLNTMGFSRFQPTRELFRGKIIYSQHEDSSGKMWFGSSQGLVALNPSTYEVIHYTQKDGLPNDVICGIQADGATLWISTNYGISKFDTSAGTFANYFYNDGLQGNEFSKNCQFQDDSGTIYFGGINGLTYFDPEAIKAKNRKPEIKITALYLGDQPINASTMSGQYQVLEKSIYESDEVQLSYDDNSFSIEFSAMEFNNPQRIQYYYAMDNEEWIGLQPGTNSLSFTNLQPGSYIFKVRAKDYNTLSDIRQLKIKIHPVWYLTMEAKIVYYLTGILILWIIYLLVRQRMDTAKKIKEQQQEQNINKAKLEFFINISHEIRTPISLIINPLKKLIKQDTDEKKHRDYFIMQRSAERILKLVNQILDIRKIDKGQLKLKFQKTDMIQFLQETSLIFDEQIHGKEIKFSINASRSVQAYIDPNHFDKVIQNILSNAIKYTPNHGEIDIYIHSHLAENNESYLTIEVCDSGAGIREEDVQRIFDRFYQSANDKNSSPEGTGIGLHLTQSIVQLHHGTIEARSNPSGPGSSFIIVLPLGRAHLQDDQIVASEQISIQDRKQKYFAPVSPIVEDLQENTRSKSKFRILIVDDDDEIRNYLSQELAEEYICSTSMDGENAYSEILKKSPDLVISDIVMPKMDGITLCRKIKHNVNINHIPVILLTAKAGEEDNLKGLEMGADAYISKPFNTDLLMKTIANLIKNRQLLKNNFNGNQFQNDKIKEIELQSSDDILMQKIMKVINDNIDNSELNVELIASEIGFSRVHLHRKLKEITSQSARDLIKNTRLKQAGDLLSSKQISISEVAYATGFSAPAKFSTAFKEFYGVTPSKFIDQQKATPADN